MKLQEEFLNIAASAIVNGYGKAAVDAAIKALALVMVITEKISEHNRDSIETDLKWFIDEKLKDLKKDIKEELNGKYGNRFNKNYKR